MIIINNKKKKKKNMKNVTKNNNNINNNTGITQITQMAFFIHADQPFVFWVSRALIEPIFLLLEWRLIFCHFHHF